MNTAYVNTSDTVRNDLDTLTPVRIAQVAVRTLRPGMILVDLVLGTPEAEIDHRVSTIRNSGELRFLAHDLNTGELITVSLRDNGTVGVLAA